MGNIWLTDRLGKQIDPRMREKAELTISAAVVKYKKEIHDWFKEHGYDCKPEPLRFDVSREEWVWDYNYERYKGK